MFTGIIEAVGKIAAIVRQGPDALVTVDCPSLDLSDVKLGDSIATNGVCLTVTKLTKTSFSADVSGETMKLTGFAAIGPGAKVNLEKAMLPTTRFGGHIVSGHVDGVGKVTQVSQLGKAWEYWIEAPADISRYIAHKGSVTVDGISLTVNEVDNHSFKLTIVPHTSDETTIAQFKVGTMVNLEVDIIARYVERMLSGQANAAPSSQGVTMATLAQAGFIK